jgi:hypothetical protein
MNKSTRPVTQSHLKAIFKMRRTWSLISMPYIFHHKAMRRHVSYFAFSLEISLKFPCFPAIWQNEKFADLYGLRKGWRNLYYRLWSYCYHYYYLEEFYCPSVYSGLKCCPLFWILLVFEIFVVTSGTMSCFLLLVNSPRLIDAFRPLTLCAEMSISLGKPLRL